MGEPVMSIPTPRDNYTDKIKTWLQEEIAEANEIIAEYKSDSRPKCDDGTDDFIEGNRNTAQRLLLKIQEWES